MENANVSIVKGELTFEDKVIQKIIGIALEEVDGLLTVDGGFFSNLRDKMINSEDVTTGIHTEVGKKQVAVDMETIYDQMKEVITREVQQMTHLEVIEVNVNVVDIKTQAEYQEESETVQDKLGNAAEATGSFMSKQTNKAKHAVTKGKTKVKENTAPRVQ